MILLYCLFPFLLKIVSKDQSGNTIYCNSDVNTSLKNKEILLRDSNKSPLRPNLTYFDYPSVSFIFSTQQPHRNTANVPWRRSRGNQIPSTFLIEIAKITEIIKMYTIAYYNWKICDGVSPFKFPNARCKWKFCSFV